MKCFKIILFAFFVLYGEVFAQSDSIVLKDITWNTTAHAGMVELFIPSGNALFAGVLYKAEGEKKHPTLILLHGYPGNERNLDLAQVVRARGWNVIYFDYRGSWGSQGTFTFRNCVEDVVNLVDYCNKNQVLMNIDTSRMVLFGHSMGGWVCLKALQLLPQIKKGFVLSAWDIENDFKKVLNENELNTFLKNPEANTKYFVLNNSLNGIFKPVVENHTFYNLDHDGPKLAYKEIVMLDEHNSNKQLAEALIRYNKSFFSYEVWQTDHSFSNKRISLVNKLLAFLER